MKTSMKTLSAITALVMLFACAAPVAANTTDEIVNVVVVTGEKMDSSYFPLFLIILSLDFTTKNAKIVSFYYETQITAVAKSGNTVSIPMVMLPNCTNGEIVNAFETTFGVPIDRYLIYVYDYSSYDPLFGALDLLLPITLEIPEELLGNERYSTINGTMQAIAAANGRDYMPIEEAGTYELDAVGFMGYNAAIPERVFASGDRFERVQEDFKYAEAKQELVTRALRVVIGGLGTDTKAAVLQKLIEGQDTNITGDDIALWASSGINLDADNPYMYAPGFDNVEMVTADTASLTVNTFQNYMLTYDNEAMKEQIRAFLYGE